jgi:parallel beta-helix repeat protein
VQDSVHVRVYGNNATFNGWDGIYFHHSNACTIEYNSASGNTKAGIGLFHSNQSVIIGNEMISNNDGLQVLASNNNTISNNTMVINTRYGIYLFPSSNNVIYQNNFLKNSQNARVIDAIANIWDLGYPDGGNFWSDYAGKDLYWGPNQNIAGGDGIGDSSYIIDYQNIDRYPLMSFIRVHDVGITDVKTTTDEVYVGRVSFFNVTTRNKGSFVENLTLMLYCNGTLTRSESVKNLPVETDAVVNFVWNTSDLKVGCTYVVKAEVDLPFEDSDTGDNAWTILVRTKMLGDVNGNRQINIIDIAAIAIAFGSHLGEDRYRLNCDMNLDGAINIVDVSVAARNFGLSY